MGGSAAEVPASPDQHPAGGLRASDAERDEVVAKLSDEFVAGRLSHDTFLHRVNAVHESKRLTDLPPLVADLPDQPAARSLGGWLRGTWARVTGAVAYPGRDRAGQDRGAGTRSVTPPPGVVRSLTSSMTASPERRKPVSLRFPSGGGPTFTIGRDSSCDLAIADLTVSRLHAQLERTPDGWLLSDLESTNGTRVNNWRVRGKVPVRPGDLVSFGTLETCFLRGDDQ